ncbi:helicase C-terminal domain-containing protein [Ottowia sp.]|uniref:ATP-dependent DNA helicase n=1 Tax=Ottowia sp. TaxID=1898956 RepID=UPI003A840D68
MKALIQAVQAVFDAGGPLSGAAEGFCVREGQTCLALAVAETIGQGGVLVAEAATGVGKTFAYLVPALLSGERVLLSTATKTLQDQLFGRDLPRLVQALGVPVRTALLKGRGSYLCLHRLALAGQAVDVREPRLRHALTKVERWAPTTHTGDLAELPGLDERSPIIPLVTSTRENCLGAECPQFRACHVNLARRQAMAADVVVINHHLFFADLAIRESGMAELLPTVRVAIFDEAHQLNETGIQFLGQHLATGQLLDLARDVLASGLQHARGLCDWMALAAGVETAARDLRLTLGAVRGQGQTRLRWNGLAPEGVDEAQWPRGLARLIAALNAAAQGLDTVSELSPDFRRLAERARLLTARAERFAQPCDPALVRWADVGAALRLVESPLDIAEAVRTRLLAAPADDDEQTGHERAGGASAGVSAGETPEATGPPAPVSASASAPEPVIEPASAEPAPPERPRAWVFTSATLGDDERLSWFTQPCGLQDARVLRIDSPFDYARQAALYVPSHLPRPADPAHSIQVARLAGDAAQRLGGRTMVLTTTLRALRTMGDALHARFGESAGLEVLVQGSLPKRALMERFRQAGQGGAPGAILVASASFWEGVDMPGEALQLVVIDKLPFPPPGDPLVEARCRKLEAEGRSAFANYSVPEAAVALKQGAGRLIRRETDTGLLVIGDARLIQMGYGRRLLAALPPMRRLSTQAEFDQALGMMSAEITA